MKTYLIGYDLNRPRGADDYPSLIKAIKDNFSSWWHHLDSTWIVKSNLSIAQIINILKQHVDPGDELLVVRLTGEWNSVGFNDDGVDWLTNQMSYD